MYSLSLVYLLKCVSRLERIILRRVIDYFMAADLVNIVARYYVVKIRRFINLLATFYYGFFMCLDI